MKNFFNIMRYLVSVLLIYIIIDNYGEKIYRLISIVDFSYILIIIILSIFQYFLSAYRWMYISQVTNLDITFMYSLKFYYISTFMNNILPGGVAGDIYRIYHTSEDKKNIFKISKSLQSVVFDRLSGQLMLFLIFILSLTFYFLINKKFIAFLYLLIPATISFFVIRKIVNNFFNRNVNKNSIIQNFKNLFWGPLFWKHTIISLFVILSYISIYIISAKSLNIEIDYLAFFIFTPIILFSMTLPISIGGWGIRETTALLVSFLLGLSASASISVSIMYGLLNLLCSLPGLFFFFTLRR